MGRVIEELTAIITADVSGALAGFDKVKSGLSGVADGLTKAGADLTKHVTLPIVGAAVAAAKTAVDFDSSMRNIQATAQLSEKQIGVMSASILDMSKNSVYGANTIAGAMYDIVGGVTDASLWNAILAQSLRTAEAGQADLKATTSGMIYIMNAYNAKAKDAALISDVLTRTVGVGVGTMDEFVGALSPIAVTAKKLKINFKDLGSMTAYLTSKGNTASESATQLQSIMQALLKPTGEMKDAIKALGYESGSAMLASLGFAGTLEALKKQAGGSSDMLAQMFARVEGFKGVLSLTSGDFAAFNANFQKGLSGATAAAQSIQAESFASQIKKALAGLEALGIQIGQILLPPFMKLVGSASEVVSWIGKLPAPVLQAGVAFLGLAAAAGPALTVLGNMGKLIGAILSPAGLLIVAITTIGALAVQHFGGLDKLMQAATTSARELMLIVGFGVFGALAAASTAAHQLATVVQFELFKVLNDAATTARQLVELLNLALNPPQKGGGTKANPLTSKYSAGNNPFLPPGETGGYNTYTSTARPFAKGGYTGETGGIVHPHEYVVPEGGALVSKGGPSILHVVLQAQDFEQHLYVNIAQAMAAGT